MKKEELIKLTNNLYCLTLLFPKKEPLRYKMREFADDILAKCLTPGVKQNLVLEDLEVLDSFFEMAKSQSWVSPSDLLAIQKEYDNLREELKTNFPLVKTPEIKDNLIEEEAQSILKPVILGRQEKILAFLRENGRAQVWQAKQIFPEVSKRTLRRDFEFLLKQGKIERMGERNETFYVPRQQADQLLS